jgi:hypothetical protein
MRFPSFLLSSFVVTSLALLLGSAGCSLKLGDKTEGDQGVMSFSYDGPGCFFGCGLDRSALQGSLVSVTAKGGDPNVTQTARIAESSIARVSKQTPSCTCDSKSGSTSTSSSIAPGEKCTGGATKTCTLSVEIETSDQGDAHLEIVGPSGALVDRVTVHVRPAARLDVSVGETAVKDDAPVTARVGDTVALETHAFDADGNEEIFTQHGISHDYGDKSILEPADDDLFGSTNVERMIARQPGDTTIKVHAPGAERVVRFHVVVP